MTLPNDVLAAGLRAKNSTSPTTSSSRPSLPESKVKVLSYWQRVPRVHLHLHFFKNLIKCASELTIFWSLT